jgi:outer membrane protein
MSGTPGSPAQGIAYINIDSVIFKFDMFLDRRNDLMSKQKSAEAELNSKGTQYQKDVKDYQDKANKGLITRATAAQIEQSLGQQQQELVSLRDKLQSNLVDEEQVMNRQILEYITKFLEENRADYNYQYILGKSFGSVVLYGDNSQDITQKVLDAINKKYKTEKK